MIFGSFKNVIYKLYISKSYLIWMYTQDLSLNNLWMEPDQLDLARELKKLWNMKVTVILVISALGMIPKGLIKRQEELEIGGQVETIQTIALLRLERIPRRVLETWGNLLSFRL